MGRAIGYGDVAQLVAHLDGIQRVRGSSPLVSTSIARCLIVTALWRKWYTRWAKPNPASVGMAGTHLA